MTEFNYGYFQPEVTEAIQEEEIHSLNIEGLPIEVAVKDIDQVSEDEYILVRRQGIGASEVSIILGVNPYKTKEELIKEKLSNVITAKERAIGEKSAVRKGRDLEPLIIAKFKQFMKAEIFKPSDMFRFKDYPYLTLNLDGVTGKPGSYKPAEIKVVTMFGEKHYNPTKAMFSEMTGFTPLPENISMHNWSIQTKAAHYGIPPYYYTQLQDQIAALDADYGYLSVLFEKDWRFYTFLIWRDNAVMHDIIVQGFKVWQEIEMRKGVT